MTTAPMVSTRPRPTTVRSSISPRPRPRPLKGAAATAGTLRGRPPATRQPTKDRATARPSMATGPWTTSTTRAPKTPFTTPTNQTPLPPSRSRGTRTPMFRESPRITPSCPDRRARGCRPSSVDCWNSTVFGGSAPLRRAFARSPTTRRRSGSAVTTGTDTYKTYPNARRTRFAPIRLRAPTAR